MIGKIFITRSGYDPELGNMSKIPTSELIRPWELAVLMCGSNLTKAITFSSFRGKFRMLTNS